MLRQFRRSGRLSQALKDALRASDKSIYQIAQGAGVSQIVVSRFLSGGGGIRMATADKLAEALGLKVVPDQRDLTGRNNLPRRRSSSTTGPHPLAFPRSGDIV